MAKIQKAQVNADKMVKLRGLAGKNGKKKKEKNLSKPRDHCENKQALASKNNDGQEK